jgi:hypothetical protein
MACFISLSWVETLGAAFLVAALFLVLLLLAVLVSCAAAGATAPNTMANAKAKAIPCFIISSESFKMDNQLKILTARLLQDVWDR